MSTKLKAFLIETLKATFHGIIIGVIVFLIVKYGGI